MSRLTRDGTADLVSQDQIIRHVRGQGDTHFPCSADHESRIGNLTRLINHIYIYSYIYITYIQPVDPGSSVGTS